MMIQLNMWVANPDQVQILFSPAAICMTHVFSLFVQFKINHYLKDQLLIEFPEELLYIYFFFPEETSSWQFNMT